ncbi:MAG: RNA pseudouridine synthase [Pseudomonadota bacterium]
MDRSLPEDVLLPRLLHRDGLILVIDKPAGLPVHAGPSGGESLEDYFDALRFGLPRKPALAHRLDRDTTGCLILGRHPKALRKLGRLFQEGQIDKVYLAICQGTTEKPSGTIDASLLKEKKSRSWRMKVDKDGQSAVTVYRTLSVNGDYHLIEARPKTGRTHQIRVHLASIGLPIVGDPVYGPKDSQNDTAPIALHAWHVTIPLTKNKDPLRIIAPVPATMSALAKDTGLTLPDREGSTG